MDYILLLTPFDTVRHLWQVVRLKHSKERSWQTRSPAVTWNVEITTQWLDEVVPIGFPTQLVLDEPPELYKTGRRKTKSKGSFPGFISTLSDIQRKLITGTMNIEVLEGIQFKAGDYTKGASQFLISQLLSEDDEIKLMNPSSLPHLSLLCFNRIGR